MTSRARNWVRIREKTGTSSYEYCISTAGSDILGIIMMASNGLLERTFNINTKGRAI